MDDAPWDPAWVFQESCVASPLPGSSPPSEIFSGWPGAEDIGPDAESKDLSQPIPLMDAQLEYGKMHSLVVAFSEFCQMCQPKKLPHCPLAKQLPVLNFQPLSFIWLLLNFIGM